MPEESQAQDANTESTQKPATSPATDTQPDKTGQGEKTFTQAELEFHISERLKRDRETQQKQIFESLGVNGLDDLKQVIEAKRKADEAQMSEVEKAQAKIAEYERKAQEAEQKLTEMQNQRIADGRKSAFADAIRQSGSDQSNHLYVLMQAEMADMFNAVFDDGSTTPDDGKMKALVKEVQTKFPMFFGTAGAGSPSNNGGVNPTSKQQSFEDAQRETIEKYGKL